MAQNGRKYISLYFNQFSFFSSSLLALLCCKAPFSTFIKCPGKGKLNKTSDRRTRGTVSSKHHSTKTFQQYLHDGQIKETHLFLRTRGKSEGKQLHTWVNTSNKLKSNLLTETVWKFFSGHPWRDCSWKKTWHHLRLSQLSSSYDTF